MGVELLELAKVEESRNMVDNTDRTVLVEETMIYKELREENNSYDDIVNDVNDDDSNEAEQDTDHCKDSQGGELDNIFLSKIDESVSMKELVHSGSDPDEVGQCAEVDDISDKDESCEENMKDEGNHICTICAKMFDDKYKLAKHKRYVHVSRKSCLICFQTFSNEGNLTRHVREIHNSETFVCCSCGKIFAREEHVRKHEKSCRSNMKQKTKSYPLISCQYCEQKFSTKFAAKRHENRLHKVEKSAGYLLKQDMAQTTNLITDHICKVCSPPIKFRNKFCLDRHMGRRHNNRCDQIKIGSYLRMISNEEVLSQASKKVECPVCKEQFSCKQYFDDHRSSVHNISEAFECNFCAKRFPNIKTKRRHIQNVHRLPTHKCSECGKMFKLLKHRNQHMKTHEVIQERKRKDISMLKRSQLYVRVKEEAASIKKRISEVPKHVEEIISKEVSKDLVAHYSKMKENPLTEAEVIDIIKDNNLSDKQLLNICKFLRNKWGRGIITPNISLKLIKRKSILDQFFCERQLDSKTELYFKSKRGKILSRSVTYCHDLPGLIAFKKLLENVEDTIENVIGVDDGKQVMKIVWNWSLLTKNDKGKDKLMGPKRSIILAAVSKVKESYHNISVLMKLTNLNEVEYLFSMDLKLINICIGIGTHSSRHPCPYGECYRDRTGSWVKGQDRTVNNIREHQIKWTKSSVNKILNRAKLKNYMNCENDPLLGGDKDKPIINMIPPPPLHTILLGPVNHVLKELEQRYPKILKTLSKLHIQRSKYHGRSFEGNQCRAILKKVHLLEIPPVLVEFKDVLLSIDQLYQLCNSQLLSSNYHKTIDNFRSAWYKLVDEYNISTTPKEHILLDHLEDYFENCNVTLIKTSDELTENMHQVMNRRMMRSFYYVKDVSNPAHGARLFRAVRHLNSYNLHI